MARFYIILACSLLLVAGANASCFRMRKSCEPGPFHGDIPGTSTKCLECTCNYKGNVVTCCSRVAFPVHYDTKECLAVLDEDNCRYNLVRIKNPNIECVVTGWTG